MSDVRKERRPGRHRRRLSLKLCPESKKERKSSAMGAKPLIKADHAKPEACWVGSEEGEAGRPALPGEGKGRCAAGCEGMGWEGEG